MSQINLGKTPSANAITPISGRCGIGIDENNIPYLVTDDGSIVPIGVTLAQGILDALSNAESPTGTNPFVTLQQIQSITGQSTILIYGGSVQYTGTGLIFTGSASGYFIEGIYYEINATTITLTAADATNDRRDLFKLDSSGWGFLTGTPSAVPVAPTPNPINEIGFNDVLIAANATTPTITEDVVYKENLDWATSSSGVGTFNADSTTQPFQGTKAFEVTNIQAGGRFIFTRSTNINLTTFQAIAFQVFLKSIMNEGRNLAVQFLDASNNAVSTIVNIPIVKSFAASYQPASIDLNQFVFSDRTQVRKLHITYVGSGGSPTYTGLYLDNIILQGGFGVPAVFEGVESVTGDGVNNTDPKNPVIDLSNYYLKSEIDPLASTGSVIQFDRPRTYGSITAPITATTLTNDDTGLKGVVQIIFHQAAELNVPATWFEIDGSEVYDPVRIAVIIVESYSTTYKRYSITYDK